MRWLALMAWLAACGGGQSAGSSYGEAESSGGEAVASAPMPAMDAPSMGMSYEEGDMSDRMRMEPPMMAQAAPPSAPSGMPAPAPQPPPPGPGPGSQAIANDATPANMPLLIYQAQLYLAVYKVEENIKAVAAAAQQAGGFLAQQTTQQIVIRVPAGKFHEVVATIEALGDVLNRHVQATDVSEEFRDIEIRLRNAMQVRDRIAELLARSQNVNESLQIERELERITREIEQMKGRLRFLQDRIAFSTITVSFQPKEQEQGPQDAFQLPFEWLHQLGLQRLLSL